MKNNNLKYYHGAIVEVMENYGNGSIIKIKGGAKLRVESAQLLDTDETKTRLPEWIAVGACAYLDGDILTITKVGNTQYEATGIKYSTHQGAINYLLHNGRAVVECDTDREPIQRPADYDKLTNISINDIHIDTDNLFELMTTANDAGADDLAAYIHGLMCSGNQPDPDTITELIDGLLWTLQEEVDDYEAEAEEVREKIEKTKKEGYEVYIDSYDDTSDPATIQNAKKLFKEDIADNINHLDSLYNNYIYPALSRLRAFVAAFSTDGATTDDPAQCAMDFEAVAAAAPAAELPAPTAAPVVDVPADDTPAPSSEKTDKKRVRIVAGSFDGCDAILFKVVNKIYGRIKIDNGQYIGFSGSGRFSFFQYNNRAEAVQEMKKYVNNTLSPLGNVIVTFTDPEEHPDMKPRTYQPDAEPDPDAIGEIVTIPANQKNAFNDAVILAQAARIKSIYEDITAEADSQPAGMSCDDLADNTPIYTAADVEKMIEAATADTYTADEVADMVAAAVAEERARHTRRRFAPRLRPVLRRLGRVAAVVLPLLIVALFIGASTASAPAADAAAETVAQVVELPAVTVTAAAVTDAPATPSPVKKLAAPSPVKKAAADAVTLPGQKTASDIATATAPAADDADSLTTAPAANGLQPTPPDGLTICAGTAWAYTMMNWA